MKRVRVGFSLSRTGLGSFSTIGLIALATLAANLLFTGCKATRSQDERPIAATPAANAAAPAAAPTHAGISGNTTKDGLDRIQFVLARHPKLVVVEFGGNDGLRGLPIEQTKANLSSIIDQLQHGGAKVVLAGITLPPDYGPDYIKTFDAMYPALAKQYHVRLLPFLLKNVYGVPGDMQNDDTHATDKGNRQVAKNVEALLRPLLKH